MRHKKQDARYRLLIVDDIPYNRQILHTICKSTEKFVMQEAEDGLEAVKMCDLFRPHIVLMDIMMPNMDGFNATKLIKKSYPETIIMVITSIVNAQVEKDMFKVGAATYLQKPIDRDLILFKLNNYVSMLQIKDGTKNIFNEQSALNAFSNEIRIFKTVFEIKSHDDIMDFGSWILMRHEENNPTSTALFERTVEFLYHTMAQSVELCEVVTVVAEEDFENIFLTLIKNSAITLTAQEEKLFLLLGDEIKITDNYIYLKVSIKKAVQPDTPSHTPAPCVQAHDVLHTVNDDEDIASIHVNDNERSLLRKSFTVKTTAEEYIKEIGDDVLEEVQNLGALENDWNELLGDLEYEPSKAKMEAFIERALDRYAKQIEMLLEFEALSYALTSLGVFLRENAQEMLDGDKTAKLAFYLGYLGQDLSSWRHNIFVARTAVDVHYLDASFFSSCLSVEGLLTQSQVEPENDDDELELF